MKVALIGCGGIALERHLPALRSIPGVTLAGVADALPDRAQAAAAQFGACAFATTQELLQHSAADVVAVCAPAFAHRELGLAVLAAGKHLFIEKPLALSLADADALVEAERAVRVRAMVGFNLRCHRLVQRARDQINRLGPIQAVHSTFTGSAAGTLPLWRRQPATGGGVLFELAVHHLDLWRFLLQTEIEFARIVTRDQDAHAALAAQLTIGAPASLILSENTRAVNEIEIFGREGHLRLDTFRFDGLSITAANVPPGALRPRLHAMVGSAREALQAWPSLRRGGDWTVSYETQWTRFLDAIRSGGPVPASLDDGRKALQPLLLA